MQTAERYVNEQLDHLGIMAGVCEEIGRAAYSKGGEDIAPMGEWDLPGQPARSTTELVRELEQRLHLIQDCLR